MGDPREPPEGTPEGGNDDEYRSVVFDEAFVRAARIQELSARERLGGFSRGVRPRIPFGPFGSLPRQAVFLLLLVAMAFAAAVYFGISSPHRVTPQPVGNQLTVSVVSLVPSSPVPAVADPKNPYAGLTGFSDGTAGLGTPSAGDTAHFTKVEVARALETVQQFTLASALAPAELVQNATGDVRSLVTPGELAQFDESVAAPKDDQHHAATGWLVRFDPSQVALASDTVKVKGSESYTEADTGTLEVTADHTFVYALRPAGTADHPAVTLFQVRRELRFEFDRTDLGTGQLRLVDAVVQAGPTSCGSNAAGYLQPILANSSSGTGPTAVDPADHSRPAWQLCAPLGSPNGG